MNNFSSLRYWGLDFAIKVSLCFLKKDHLVKDHLVTFNILSKFSLHACFYIYFPFC